MYKCKVCGNTTDFEEVNIIKTHIKQNEKGEIIHEQDEYGYRENCICLDCEKTMEDGDIVEVGEHLYNEEYKDMDSQKQLILNEITDFCDAECRTKEKCPEKECVLFRIEKIIEN